MLENAVRICEAKFGNLFLYEENSFRIVAQQNPPPAWGNPSDGAGSRSWWSATIRLTRSASLAETRGVVHIADLATEQGYVERDPRIVSLVESAGARTHLLVPMLKEGELIGAIAIYARRCGRSPTSRSIFVQNFAAQAVIAIENTRLLSELRKSLERQTATADVLKVISSSPGELEPVFQAMLENATRLCAAAKFGNTLSL